MNKSRTFICFLIIAFALLLPQIALAEGSLESSGNGLWNYYRDKPRTSVRRNAPMFERLKDSTSYLLDYTEIKGVELYLTGQFSNNRLSSLQIITPFPEYKSCNKDTKDTSKSFAAIAYVLMGVEFDAKKQCTQTKDNGGTMICTAEDFVCAYRLCPDANWSLACSVLE